MIIDITIFDTKMSPTQHLHDTSMDGPLHLFLTLTFNPSFILIVNDNTCSGTFFSTTSNSTSNTSIIVAATNFICVYAISFPKHTLGPP
ncbi:hypothetical protein Hanom_Chr06g00517041 [Helianthus anomalus]